MQFSIYFWRQYKKLLLWYKMWDIFFLGEIIALMIKNLFFIPLLELYYLYK